MASNGSKYQRKLTGKRNGSFSTHNLMMTTVSSAPALKRVSVSRTCMLFDVRSGDDQIDFDLEMDGRKKNNWILLLWMFYGLETKKMEKKNKTLSKNITIEVNDFIWWWNYSPLFPILFNFRFILFHIFYDLNLWNINDKLYGFNTTDGHLNGQISF